MRGKAAVREYWRPFPLPFKKRADWFVSLARCLLRLRRLSSAAVSSRILFRALPDHRPSNIANRVAVSVGKFDRQLKSFPFRWSRSKAKKRGSLRRNRRLLKRGWPLASTQAISPSRITPPSLGFAQEMTREKRRRKTHGYRAKPGGTVRALCRPARESRHTLTRRPIQVRRMGAASR